VARTIVSKIVRLAGSFSPVATGEEQRLRYLIGTASVSLGILIRSIWGIGYLIAGEQLAGNIQFLHSALMLVGLVLFSRRVVTFRIWRFFNITLLLIFPFAMTLVLGGFINSSAIIMWSLLAPLLVLVTTRPPRVLFWALCYISLVAVCAILQPLISRGTALGTNVIVMFFVLNLVGVSSFVLFILSFFVDQRIHFQERTDSLLLSIFPAEIASKLKIHDETIANCLEDATVLFADLVDFTDLCKDLAPERLVELLDEVFSDFDGLMDRHGLEKIKTIGDCYMAAAGVPRPRSDHARAAVACALDMHELVGHISFIDGVTIRLRIGISSGTVIAGVIGRKKFTYDLWGDPVNMASKMEFSGSIGKTQITRSTYELVKDEFVCVPAGTVDVKGKGPVNVWHVEAALPVVPD